MVAFVCTYKQFSLIGGNTCIEPRAEPIDYFDYNAETFDDCKYLLDKLIGLTLHENHESANN